MVEKKTSERCEINMNGDDYDVIFRKRKSLVDRIIERAGEWGMLSLYFLLVDAAGRYVLHLMEKL